MSNYEIYPLRWKDRLRRFFHKATLESQIRVSITTKKSWADLWYSTVIMSHKQRGPMLVLICSEDNDKTPGYERRLLNEEAVESVRRAIKKQEKATKPDTGAWQPPVYGAVLRGTDVECYREYPEGSLRQAIHEAGAASGGALTGPIQLPLTSNLMAFLPVQGNTLYDQNGPQVKVILDSLEIEWELERHNGPLLRIEPVRAGNGPKPVIPLARPSDAHEESSRASRPGTRGRSDPGVSSETGLLGLSPSATPSELGLVESQNPATSSGDESYGMLSTDSSANLGSSPKAVDNSGSSDDNNDVASVHSEDSDLVISASSRGIGDEGSYEDIASDQELVSHENPMIHGYRTRKERDLARSPSIDSDV